ncbi:RNF144 [Lepeophtheirus salmonis]|uniref:RBR-type E3 ubiquitin transferase n=1 Tax=Lepeophtheirus salmonis TaxID=72036 RepID=A0A7R8CPG4_LEPSM|nr:RNF144 [Lepeophtheirus salmonis]CAF2886168.1 RNF144 [Lepeophtheirus salmonis]
MIYSKSISTSTPVSKENINPYLLPSENEIPKECFLCQRTCSNLCPDCKSVYICSEEHGRLHRHEDGLKCYSYRASSKPGDWKDPYFHSHNQTWRDHSFRSRNSRMKGIRVRIVGYLFVSICQGVNVLHTPEECRILSKKDWSRSFIPYPLITPLRLLLKMEMETDDWNRANQLMDHYKERSSDKEDWDWYQNHVVNVLRNDLGLNNRFSEKEIHRAIGLMNVNAVALQFPKFSSSSSFAEGSKVQDKVGKGLFPIFAIMSHYCVCNARYQIHPKNMKMYVRARGFIKKGEEISVQYLSALYGNFIRRRKIREDWYFDCVCSRCKDSTERGSYVSAIYCDSCYGGLMLPKEPLDYESPWICDKCHALHNVSEIISLVQSLETELNDVAKNKTYDKYEDFIDKYSETLLHSSHYLLMTAKRNLIQYWTYGISNEALSLVQLEKKIEMCHDFLAVLTKIDPGCSELRNFIQREYNYSKLTLCKINYELGYIGKEEFAFESRACLGALTDRILILDWILLKSIKKERKYVVNTSDPHSPPPPLLDSCGTEPPASMFNVPESNASDIQSDTQDFYSHSASNEPQSTPLSSKQQVALWLTHTSMTNLSSMPSIKSLVNKKYKRKSSSNNSRFQAIKPYQKHRPMERNDSTKSLAQPFRSNIIDEIPMRKCETVLTLTSVQGLPHSSYSSKTQSCPPPLPPSQKPHPQPILHPTSRTSEISRPPSIVGCESLSQGLRPVNRLRSKSSIITPNELKQQSFICKICLCDFYNPKDMVRLEQCGCSSYCKDCIVQYLTFEILEGAYEISCPDAECEKDGIISLEEIEKIIGKELFEKHTAFRLNAEVAMDPNRAWCPQAGCDTICHICRNPKQEEAVPVKCPTCDKEFCSQCSSAWHPNFTCRENGSRLVRNGGYAEVTAPSWICDDPEGNIKQCPTCKVPIERNAGCAQMMYDDFLLRHYDSGQSGFGVFLLVASPLLLIVAPCILCCKCKFFKRLGEAPSSATTTQPNLQGMKSTSISIEEDQTPQSLTP